MKSCFIVSCYVVLPYSNTVLHCRTVRCVFSSYFFMIWIYFACGKNGITKHFVRQISVLFFLCTIPAPRPLGSVKYHMEAQIGAVPDLRV